MKNILKTVGVLLLVTIGYYVWYVHLNFRFEEITKDKVYRSALIDPNKIDNFLLDNNIKTVINLLDSGVKDELNPGEQNNIDAEDKAILKFNKEYDKNVSHVHIPSGQVPTKKTLSKFFKVLDNPESYPVLIHCYHGTGRAEMYTALYRVEYEDWKNKDARAETRAVIEALGYRSSFADGKEKGDFLMNYKPRTTEEKITYNN